MDSKKNKYLKEKAAEIRSLILDAVYYGGSGHPGGSLSSADIIAYLYFDKMNVSVENPHDPARDRFVL
ncbi:MAG: transketolase, partial [Victivallales bacterium]